MKKFAGKVALVTGSTAGIGRTTAIAFAARGASVVTTGLSEAGGQETVRLIQAAGGEGLFVKADLTQATEYVLLASSDGSFMTGSLVEVSGGIVAVG